MLVSMDGGRVPPTVHAVGMVVVPPMILAYGAHDREGGTQGWW